MFLGGTYVTKTIIFDFWGTLVENGTWSPIKQVRNILRINDPFPEYVVRMEKAMMTSSFANLKDAFKAVAKEFNIKTNGYLLDKLVGIWNKSWMLAKPYPEVEEQLKKLQKDYQLILISNTDCFSIKNVLTKFDLQQYFNKIYFSYELGLIKTNPDFMDKILKENNLNPEDCLLVGDSIQSDIEAAKRKNIKGVLLDRKESRDFDPKIKNLKELDQYL